MQTFFNDQVLAPCLLSALRIAEQRGFLVELHFGIRIEVSCWPYTETRYCHIVASNLESLPWAIHTLAKRQDLAKKCGGWSYVKKEDFDNV